MFLLFDHLGEPHCSVSIGEKMIRFRTLNVSFVCSGPHRNVKGSPTGPNQRTLQVCRNNHFMPLIVLLCEKYTLLKRLNLEPLMLHVICRTLQ